MKRIFCSVLLVLCMCAGARAEFSCGAGYILAAHAKIDGVPAAECQKLWCRDLETGRAMGSGNTAATGYRMTDSPNRLCMGTDCVECWGARRWCSGEEVGEWNETYGGYTRGGDNATYQSYLKGNCFAWHLERPNCPAGEYAKLTNGRWECLEARDIDVGTRASGVRRTGGIRSRVLR